MAKETDQTRWVGIRPTDPSEDIPTTTKKLAPAIGDLQAIKERYGTEAGTIGKDCSVSVLENLPAVPAGEIWVVTNITAVNETTICDIIIRPVIAGNWRTIKCFYSVEPDIHVSWSGMIVLINPDYIGCYFELGGVADTVRLFASGYKIGAH